MIIFNCSQCGSRFQVDDKLAGRKAKCSRCGQETLIPLPHEPPMQPPKPARQFVSDRSTVEASARVADDEYELESPPQSAAHMFDQPGRRAMIRAIKVDHDDDPGEFRALRITTRIGEVMAIIFLVLGLLATIVAVALPFLSESFKSELTEQGLTGSYWLYVLIGFVGYISLAIFLKSQAEVIRLGLKLEANTRATNMHCKLVALMCKEFAGRG